MAVLETWAAAPSWLLPFRSATVRTLHWVHEHWLDNAAILTAATIVLALATIALVVVTTVLGRMDRSRNIMGGTRQTWEREQMLHRVRRNWITGVLQSSLAGAAELVLSLTARPDALAPGSVALLRHSRPPILGEAAITEVFHEAGGRLLILGDAGAGKTILLLQLAEGLLWRAESDLRQPIPVVFNLSSWGSEHKSLETWLVEELSAEYEVDHRTGSAWVAQNELTLLLDGLDEVAAAHRAACAEAINEYRRTHGFVQLAVCSRTKAAEDLAVKLHLEEAVQLQPLTDDEVGTCLGKLEQSGTSVADVRAALPDDHTLREMLRSPLMLQVICLAYRGRPVADLTRPGSADERRKRLWQAYVDRMFEKRPLPAQCDYSREQAIGWLVWLAGALRSVNQTEFRIDKLTTTWLPVRTSRSGRPRTRSFLAEAERTVFPNWEVISPGHHVHRWFPEGGTRRVRKTVRLIGVPVAAAGAGLTAVLGAGPLAGVAAAIAAWLAARVLLPSFIWFVPWRESNSRVSWAGSNQGTWRAAKHGAKAGLAAAIFFGGFYGLGFGLVFGPWYGLITTLAFGLWFGLIAGMFFGGMIFATHFAVRALLVRSNAAPWRYQAFLDAMAERLLLRRSGTSYLFSHQLLRDYFADYAIINGTPHNGTGKPVARS